jgi:hypothetical protein
MLAAPDYNSPDREVPSPMSRRSSFTGAVVASVGLLALASSASAQQKPNTGWLRVNCNDGYDQTSPRRISVYRNGKLYNQTDMDPKTREQSYYNFPTGPVEVRVQVGTAKPEVKSTEVSVSNGNLDTSTVMRFSCRAGSIESTDRLPVGVSGQAKETFKTQISMGMGGFEATFTVSERGYNWAGIDGHYHSNGLIPWKDVRKWSCSGEAHGFALDVHQQTGANTFQFRHDDLVTIVDKYFKKYVGEKLDGGCNPEGS